MATIGAKNKNQKKQTDSGLPEFKSTRLSSEEQLALGKQMRASCPRTSHATWQVPARRPDPVLLIKKANEGRIPELIPLRHGRMVQSPFTFYRAGALNMAVDLANTPNTGIKVQCCGDAHLCNFGGFATPERNVIFSINDLDETLPAPWEWDLKRLTTSFVIACRNNGLSETTARDVVLEVVKSYREYMATFSEMKTLELWYYRLDTETLIGKIKDNELRKRAIKRIEKEKQKRIEEEIFPKLVQSSGKIMFIKDQPPTIFHWQGHNPGEIDPLVKKAFDLYLISLSPAHLMLLNRYELKDAAIKVVGVGSVGTVCWVLLLVAGSKDHLMLQVKQAKASVMEPFAGKSIFPNHGQRVVNGYRLMQPSSDIFLGWTRGENGRDFYFRQLRDIKISIAVETFGKAEMLLYAQWCSQALALSHARSGESKLISSYLGKSDVIDKAIAAFSTAYADQNEKDYTLFKKTVINGKLEAVFE